MRNRHFHAGTTGHGDKAVVRIDADMAERKNLGSQEAVASLHDGACDLTGFHVPLGDFEAGVLQQYLRWLDPRNSHLICLAVRR